MFALLLAVFRLSIQQTFTAQMLFQYTVPLNSPVTSTAIEPSTKRAFFSTDSDKNIKAFNLGADPPSLLSNPIIPGSPTSETYLDFDNSWIVIASMREVYSARIDPSGAIFSQLTRSLPVTGTVSGFSFVFKLDSIVSNLFFAGVLTSPENIARFDITNAGPFTLLDVLRPNVGSDMDELHPRLDRQVYRSFWADQCLTWLS